MIRFVADTAFLSQYIINAPKSVVNIIGSIKNNLQIFQKNY